MIRVKSQKHLIYFNQLKTYYTSYEFHLDKPSEKEQKQKNNDDGNKQLSIKIITFEKLEIQIHIQHQFTFEWISDYYRIDHNTNNLNYGQCPFSLETYLQMYRDPKIHTFHLTLGSEITEQMQSLLFGSKIGKIIIKTTFLNNPFKLPVNILSSSTLNTQCTKKVSIFSHNNKQETVFCSGQFLSTEIYEQVAQFESDSQLEGSDVKKGYKLLRYEVEQRVQAKNIVVFKGAFQIMQFSMDKAIIKIYSIGQINFLSTLNQILMQIKINMIQIESLHIFQNVNTEIEDGYRTVFYSNLNTLYKRIYRSYLHNKIKDEWIIEGMINYNRSNKHLQNITKQLIDLITDGEEIVSLQQEVFPFDPVWKIKATFFYHIISNFKLIRDFGSSSLANLIIEQSRKAKVTSQLLFKRLKNKYGLKNFRTIYEQQFIKSTGINRIYYEIIDLKRQNKVKIIVRQKSLSNRFFSLYNKYRIKLQLQYKHLSQLTSRIINKNGFQNTSQGKIKKELVGPLAVPKILKCLPYFRGNVTVQTDASEIAFQLQLKQENIIQEKQNVTSKIRAPIRKIGDNQKTYDGYGWMMIDTAHIFPAVYKNDNVHESVILQKIKKRYDSEHEELKVLNCISSRDHSKNEKICRALIQKLKINTNYKENSTINVKLKILQILPVFLSNAVDFSLWEEFLGFLKLYEPVCQDYSDDGYYFLLSLIESAGQIQYKKQFSYYFQHFHRIMLRILREHNEQGQQRQQKLKQCLFDSMMKWKSRYSLQIIEEVLIELKLSRKSVRQNIQLLKTIFRNIYPYLDILRLETSNFTVRQVHQIMAELISKDKSYSLFTIKFVYDIKESEKTFSKPFYYLKSIFIQLENLENQSIRKYSMALQTVKNILNKSKKLCGLQIQLFSTENENYFLAQYLWDQVTCELSCNNHFIRLQWIKIYRIFYFYYTPIITVHKLLKNPETREFKHINADDNQQIIDNYKDFTPDIKWLSGYDSRSAKELKAKYELMNQNKRKKKIEEYHFSQNNAITQFIKSHPGRDTWDELGRQAIRIFISIYEDKEQKTDGKEAELYKKVQEGFKGVEQKLKRGRMPDFYNYNQLKQQIMGVLQLYNQQEIKVIDILKMVDKSLEQIQRQRMRQEAEIQEDDMHIIIGLNSILEQGEQEEEEGRNPNAQENNQQNQGNEDQMLFIDEYEQQKFNNEEQIVDEMNKSQDGKDDDQLMFEND